MFDDVLESHLESLAVDNDVFHLRLGNNFRQWLVFFTYVVPGWKRQYL